MVTTHIDKIMAFHLMLLPMRPFRTFTRSTLEMNPLWPLSAMLKRKRILADLESVIQRNHAPVGSSCSLSGRSRSRIRIRSNPQDPVAYRSSLECQSFI